MPDVATVLIPVAGGLDNKLAVAGGSISAERLTAAIGWSLGRATDFDTW